MSEEVTMEYPKTLMLGDVEYVRADIRVRAAKVSHPVANIPGRDELVGVFVNEHTFNHVLDVGCGPGVSFPMLASKGALVTGIDILPERMVNTRPGGTHVDYIQADFMEYTSDKKYDAVIASHVVEHMPDTERFLRRFMGFLSPGGTYCLIWPKPKTEVVGGHVHLFNMGTMLYNLVRLGVNCRDVQMLRCEYSLGIIGKLETFEVPQLTHDFGDIERLAWWFPFPATQGFEGTDMPEIRDVPATSATDG